MNRKARKADRFVSFTILGALVLTAALLSSCSDSCNDSGDNKYSAEASSSITVARLDRTEFVLNGVNGSIEAEGDTAATSIGVSWVRRVRSDSQADADARLPEIEVVVDTTDSSVRIETDQPDDTEGRDYIVDYTVALPAGMTVSIGNANGYVGVADVEASVSVSVANGEIDAELVPVSGGAIVISLANGTIDARIPADASAEFSASLANGTVTVSGLTLTDASVSQTRVTGTLGAGDGTITLSAANGTIVVTGI